MLWKGAVAFFDYVSGKLVSTSAESVVIDVGGLGYRLLVSAQTLRQLPPLGSSLKLHTLYVVKETSALLYGFGRPSERDLFELLTSVSGVGPKLALSLLGTFTLRQLKQAVRDQEVRILSQAPGIGRKTAERLVLELRDKLTYLEIEPEGTSGNRVQDAIGALIHLGYTRHAAEKAVESCLQNTRGEEPAVEELIRTALQSCQLL